MTVDSLNHEPRLLTRSLGPACLEWLDRHMNAKGVIGYSNFHYSLINTAPEFTVKHISVVPLPVTSEEQQLMEQYELQRGEKFVIWPYSLPVCQTGDGFTGSHLPFDEKKMAMSYVNVCAFKPELAHCRQAGVLVLLSSFGDKDLRVIKVMQQL